MSSEDVRQAITAAVTQAALPYPVYDMSDFNTNTETLTPAPGQKTVLVQYVTSDERMVTISGPGNQGYEQSGSVVLHVIENAGFPSSETVTYCDQIREALRGQRLSQKLSIESVTPFTDFSNNAVGLDGGTWKGWASNLIYVSRDCG